MPKIRCRGCEKILNIPDKARGKVVQCPHCQTKLKVPGGEKSPPAKSGKKPARKSDSVADFGDLDLDSFDMEAEGEQICPYCAAEMDEEDPVCRSCGMNVETGKMDVKEEKRRTRKGVDPALFYSRVFPDSWTFLMEEKGLAVRTALSWSLFGTLHAICAYVGLIYIQEQLPPKVFWVGMTILTFLGIPGWYWTLSTKVVGATVLKEQFRSDRIQFDMFTAIASGIRAVFWPLIVMGPVTPLLALLLLAGVLIIQDPLVLGLLGVLLLALPALLLPIAMVHMTAKYTYKGWIFWELIKLFFKNAGPTLFLWIVAVGVCLPAIGLTIGMLLLIQHPNPIASEVILGINDKIALWIMGLADMGTSTESWSYMMIKLPLNILATALVITPLAFAFAFPAVFLMRANGLFGMYNNATLGLVPRMTPGTPATFWVRYLSHTIDFLLVPLAGFLVTANQKALMVGWAVNGIAALVYFFSPQMLPFLGPIWPLYMGWMYWVVQESSELRSTIGKDAFGLIVTTDDNKQMTMQQGSAKWALRVLFYVPVGLPFLMAAFHPQKKALHDIITKSKVVWKGDR